MYEVLIAHLRECAKLDPSNNTYAEAADAIEEIQGKYFLMKKTAEWLAEKVPRWIPVTERLPTRGDRVLCFGDNGINIVDFVCGDKWCALPWFYLDGEQETGVAYWMPLPEPPKEEET